MSEYMKTAGKALARTCELDAKEWLNAQLLGRQRTNK